MITLYSYGIDNNIKMGMTMKFRNIKMKKSPLKVFQTL